MRNLFVAASVILCGAIAYAGENKSPGAQAVDQNCKADAATANCGSEKVGTGLYVCLDKYHKATPAFKLSEACQKAVNSEQAEGIDRECKKDAATASCGKDKVGSGLLDCLEKYQKANASMKFTKACEKAISGFHAWEKI